MQGRCYSRWQLNGPSGEPIYWLPHHRMVSQYSYIWRVSVINLRWKFRGAELVPKFSLYFSATFQLHIQTYIQKTEFGFCFLALKIKNKSGHQNFWSKVLNHQLHQQKIQIIAGFWEARKPALKLQTEFTFSFEQTGGVLNQFPIVHCIRETGAELNCGDFGVESNMKSVPTNIWQPHILRRRRRKSRTRTTTKRRRRRRTIVGIFGLNQIWNLFQTTFGNLLYWDWD